MRFTVWAPDARTVDLDLSGECRAMTAAQAGWWSVTVEDDVPPGTTYAFRVDRGPPLPDPRSPSQPSGVHGPSATVDHASFPWTDGGWRGTPLAGAVFYELHVGTFTPDGTFDGVITRLDHLVDLGVTLVELMPVAEFPGGHGWGYDGVDLYAPHHTYGGPDGLKRLVDACHARGLGVVLDVVYNHLGPAGNYLDRFGPYFTDRYATPWGRAVNLDGPGSDEVRAFFVDNALMWLRDYHIDGLRLDAVHAVIDTSAVHLLEELAGRVDELQGAVGRQLFLVAESDRNDPRVVRAREAGGYGLDAQWSDDFHHALHAALTGEQQGYYADFGSLHNIATALTNAFVYAGRHSAHRGRRHGRPATGLSGHRFLGFLQNHDQVGNQAQGDRASHLMTLGRAKVGAALVLTAPFVPLLFQGEEWAASSPFQYFTDHEDAELARAVSEGRRRELAAIGWRPDDVPDPQDPATFERSCLDWDEVDGASHAEMLEWYTALVALRKRSPDLLDGRLDRVITTVDEDAGTLVVERAQMMVAVNVGLTKRDIANPDARRVVLASDPAIIEVDGSVRLPPDSVAILS